uniref:Alpha-mannosidase n=1 Tax=Cacopsylla melanoneura TaxID=428564 RepID=A0A8D8PLF5_9HEMI
MCCIILTPYVDRCLLWLRSVRYVKSLSQVINMRLLCILGVILSISIVALCYPSFTASKYKSNTDEPVCGYESCPVTKDNVLNVHIIPHSHDDVGWLKTVDQYYWGTKSGIQLAGVQFILDSVIRELVSDPKKKFIYVETAFFWKWWTKQDELVRKQVRLLVNEGRLEFIGGAWAMNDEAAVHYTSTIDQFSWGLRRLNDTFGKCARPRVGWQIDPFGHSREQASLFSQMGYDGFMFGRLDYQDKRHRLDRREMEMIWQGSESIGHKGNIFTHALYNTYSAPNGFCFDILCGEAPLVDDEQSPEYNIKDKIDAFLKYVKTQGSHYTSNNIVITMGDDFNYQYAHRNFKDLDQLIKYVNKRQDSVYAFYSTPSCYLKAVNAQNLNYTVKTDDFFPYCSDNHACWTGYFTSRPTTKYFERLAFRFSQVTKQLDTQIDAQTDLAPIKEAVGIMQHHDAITGTEKQHVAYDYARIVFSAINETHNVTEEALKKLLIKEDNGHADNIVFYSCLKLNMSECEISERAQNFVVTLYNPLSHPVDYNVRVPVQSSVKYTVHNGSGIEITTQTLPIHPAILNNPARKSSIARVDLVFKAAQIPPLGLLSFFVTGTPSDEIHRPRGSNDVNFVGNNNLGLKLNHDGSIKSVITQSKESSFSQEFAYYIGASGDNRVFERRSSGAYIFRNNGSSIPIVVNSSLTYNGNLVSEIHQTFSVPWINQVIRLYKDTDYIDFQWIVGPIPIDDGNGKEIITRYSMNGHLSNQGVFYTDSNGREMLKRVKDYRPTWNYEVNEPISGNYYPVTSRISLKAESNLTVLVDRAEGGTGMQEGQAEIMVHRRLLHDDAFGVGEALNETENDQGLVVFGHHSVLVNKRADQESLLQLEQFHAPWTFLTPANDFSWETWIHMTRGRYSGLTRPLPSNVHILTLEAWKHGTVLLRLEHIMERSNGDASSTPVRVNIENLFTKFTILSARETNLAANEWLEDSQRLVWKSNQVDEVVQTAKSGKVDLNDIVLGPMEIRTFVLEVSYHG